MSKMEKFVEAKNRGEVIRVTVTYIDKKNYCLVAYERDEQEGDITIQMSMADYYEKDAKEIEKMCENGQVNFALGKTISGKVSAVNQIRRLVTLSACDMRSVMKETIDAELLAGTNRVVEATVSYIGGKEQSSYAVLVGPDNIHLLLLARDWNYDYVDDLKDVVKSGDKVRVKIWKKYGEYERETRKNIDYVVSRRELLPNPWVGIEQRFHKGDTTICKLVKRWKDGYACRIEGVSGIIAYCETPRNNAQKDLRLVIGERYVCGVANIKEETRSLRVHPFVHVREGEQN